MMWRGMPGWPRHFTASVPRISALELLDEVLVGRISRGRLVLAAQVSSFRSGSLRQPPTDAKRTRKQLISGSNAARRAAALPE